MEAHKRRQVILSLIREHGEVGVDELAARLGVSANTIRNDLNSMAAESSLTRVRGGAIMLEEADPARRRAFTSRAQTCKQEKELIGGWAAELVRDGDTIVLDASSTVYHMTTFLQERQDLTVVTNGLETAILLAHNPSNRVILAADTVRSNGFSIIGRLNPDLRQRFLASKCFVSCSGFSDEHGLMEVDIDEGPLKEQMLTLAEEVIALVDASKFARTDTYLFAELDQIDHLITDDGVDPQHLQKARQAADFPITVVADKHNETYEPGQDEVGGRRYRIGFANLTERMVFAQQVQYSMQQAATRFECFDVLIRDNDADRDRALENADWFVEQAVDLVVEYHIDVEDGSLIMDRFNQAGIPVLAVDIPMPGATFFGADNFRAGHMAGEALGGWIREHWQGQLDILLKLETPTVGPVTGARLLGQQVGLESTLGFIAADQVISVETPGILEATLPLIQVLLPDFDRDARIGIIGVNDEAVVGALQAFAAENRLKQVVAVGQNADRMGIEALRQGDLPFIGTTRFAPETYGDRILNLALRILRREVVPPAVYSEHVFITRDNIDDYYPQQDHSIPANTMSLSSSV